MISTSKFSSATLCLAAVPFVCLSLASCVRSPAQKEARFIQKGKDLVQKHDYQRAILEFRNAIQVMPKDAEPIYQLALVYLDMHDSRMAYALLKKAVSVNPKHAEAQLAIAKFQTGAPDKAVLNEAKQRVQGVLATDPNSTEALDTLAALNMRLGNTDEALQNLDKALTKSPQDLHSAVQLANLKLSQHDAAGAESVLKTAVQNAPQSSDAALTLAVFYLKHDRKLEAEELVHRALELDPKSQTALLLTAAFQIDHGQTEQAEQTYARVSALPNSSLKPLHAAFLLKEGKRDQGIGELNTLVEHNPDDRNLRSMLVSAYMQAGKPQEAERILNAALQRNPKNVNALLQRSTFFLNAGKLDQTAADLRTVLAANPDSGEAHYGLARVAAARGSVLVQRQELDQALRFDPRLLPARIDYSTLLRPKDPKAALQILDDAPGDQKQQMSYVVERNWVLLGLNDATALRTSLDTVLSTNHLPVLLYQDALLRYSQKDYAGARTALEGVLTQNPEDMSAVDLKGKTYLAQGNKQKAFEVVQEQASKKPNSVLLLSLVGIWQANDGHFAEARQAFSRAVAVNPAYTPAHLALADVDVSMGNLPEAKSTLQQVLSKEPLNMQAQVRLADVEAMTGDKASAQKVFQSVVQAEPTNERALNGLAYTLADDRPEEALKYAQTAVELAPNDPTAQDTLGWIYYRKNLYDSAITYFKSASQKQPTAVHKYHLALAYSKTGDRQRAEENLKAALQLDPKLQMPERVLQ